MPLLLFWAILRSTGGDGLHSSESIRLKEVPFFFFFSPGLGLRGLAFAVLACFPPGWNGGFHLWRFPGSLLVEVVPSSADGFSPIQEPWVPGYLVSLALGLSSYCLRHIQVACSYRCCSCSSHPSPALFSLAKTLASWVWTVSSAPDSEQAFPFGSFSLLGVALRPRLLLT